MFAVIYRGSVKPHLEEAFKKHWRVVASYFVKDRGAIGSSLHRGEEGLWVAYSRWPDKETRDRSWPREGGSVSSDFPAEVKGAIEGLRECFVDEYPEICMNVVEEISF